ncbi:lipase 2 [Colletotrichum tofieldiae]|nr:lipase 2 [Colletotrichum tofieldiae]GKT71847.1 lipase 2 [Colletotrichum tofieldiae]GKT94972.1 lipase 2 [Colletotrichum tofieldiae]
MAPRSREELLAFGTPDPFFEAELAANPLREPQPSDPYYGRNDFFAMREHRATRLRELHHLRYLPGPIPDQVREEDRKITARDGYELTLRIYTPVKALSEGSPLIVMYHEGGWSSGDLSDEEVAENASNLGADPSHGFIIGGGSAGGNIAAVLAHLARDNKLSPPITGQYLCVPAIMCLLPPEAIPEQYRSEYLNHPFVTPSKDPVVGPSGSDGGAGLQSIVKPDMESPLFVPFHFGGIGQGHKGLPPAYFQVAGLDLLRDEALIYERILREEVGVKTKLDIYPGLPHYFWTNFPRLEKSKQFVEDTVKGVRWLLEQK